MSRTRSTYLMTSLFMWFYKGAVITYDQDGGRRDMGPDMGGGLEKMQYPKRGFEKVFHS